MKKILIFTFFVMLMVGVVGFASAAVLDFEGLNGNLPNPYGPVNWESGSWYVYDDVEPPYNPHSGTGRTYESDDITPSWAFLQDVVFNGAYFSGNVEGNANLQMDLYLNGNLVHATGTFYPTDVSTFFATNYSGLVDAVVINTTTPDLWVMDDLTYNAQSVPEPTTMLLLGLGLVGLAGIRRKFKK